MLKLACAVLLAVAVAGAPVDILDGTELVMTFLVHRHGDRTPVESTLNYSNHPDTLIELTAPYGFGQLTTTGKRRAYQLGKSLRERYNDFIPSTFDRNQVYIRSTDSTRTKMTVLSELAAIFPPAKNVFEGINWTPVPYTTLPPKYDINLASVNCPVVIEKSAELMASTSEDMINKYGDVLKLMSEHTGADLIASSGLTYAVFDEFNAQKSLGLPIDPELEAVWSDIEAAAGAGIDFVYGNPAYIAYQAGPFLNEFYKASSDFISGNDTQKVRIYSAHDFNVFSFQAVTKITNKQGGPKYASAYILELRRVVESGKYVVVPVYLPCPGEEFIYLNVDGCGSVCDYDEFVKITSEFAMDEDTWRTKCGWTEDIYIDDSSFA